MLFQIAAHAGEERSPSSFSCLFDASFSYLFAGSFSCLFTRSASSFGTARSQRGVNSARNSSRESPPLGTAPYVSRHGSGHGTVAGALHRTQENRLEDLPRRKLR